MKKGQGHDITPAGMLALDVARIEAGLILAEVEYMPSRKAVIDAQMSSPLELSLDWTLAANKGPFIGRKALLEEQKRGPARRTVGLQIDWQTVERFYWDMGLPPQPPTEPWREKVPLYSGYRQIGWATSGCWSPLLKRYIAIATVASPYSRPGTRIEIEVAVEGERHRAPATVVERPFFEPQRKKAWDTRQFLYRARGYGRRHGVDGRGHRRGRSQRARRRRVPREGGPQGPGLGTPLHRGRRVRHGGNSSRVPRLDTRVHMRPLAARNQGRPRSPIVRLGGARLRSVPLPALPGRSVLALSERRGLESEADGEVLEEGRRGLASVRTFLGRVRGTGRADLACAARVARGPRIVRPHPGGGRLPSTDHLHVHRGHARRILRVRRGEGVLRHERGCGDDGGTPDPRDRVRAGPPYAREHRRSERSLGLVPRRDRRDLRGDRARRSPLRGPDSDERRRRTNPHTGRTNSRGQAGRRESSGCTGGPQQRGSETDLPPSHGPGGPARGLCPRNLADPF